MVDHGSDIYYNYTPLMEVHKDKNEPPLPPPEQSQQLPVPSDHIQAQRNQAMQMQQQQHHHQLQSHQSIHLSEAGPGSMPGGAYPPGQPQYLQHAPQQPYPPNGYQTQPMMNGMVQLQQAPMQTQQQMMGPPPGQGQGGFSQDVYIPPDIQRNPRRTTRANGQQGMYRV